MRELPNELRIDVAGGGKAKRKGLCAAARKAVRVACPEPVEGNKAIFGKRNHVYLLVWDITRHFPQLCQLYNHLRITATSILQRRG